MGKWDRGNSPKETRMSSASSYALLFVFFCCVVFLGTVFSITETQRRIHDPAQTPAPILTNIIGEITQRDKPSAEELEAERERMNYWPEEEFPSIPRYEAGRYQTTVENRLATIVLSAEDGVGLKDYADSLLRSGAKLLVELEGFTALIQAGCEVHIFSTGASPKLELCGEPTIALQNMSLPDSLILPEGGRPVAAVHSESASTYTFTYRNAAINDVLKYINALIAENWQSVHRVVQKGNTFFASYKKGENQLTVDYFTDGEYTITFKDP